MAPIRAFIDNEGGVTAIEYGLIAGLVAVAIVVSLTNVYVNLNNTFFKVSNTVSAAAAA